MNNNMKELLNDLQPIDFVPNKYPSVFRKVASFRLEKLFDVFDFVKRNIDYFYDNDLEVKVPGTQTLLVISDKTNTIPMSDERSLTGERYLTCRLFFVKTKDNDVYYFGTDERGLSLTDVILDRFIFSCGSK